MQARLAAGLTLAVATVCGTAVWRRGDHVVPGAAGPVALRAELQEEREVEGPVIRIGAIEQLARALVRLLDAPQRSDAENRIAGLDWSRLNEAQRAVAERLLERLAEALCGAAAPEAVREFEAQAFAWSGGEAACEGAWLRISGRSAALEFRRAAGTSTVEVAWRDGQAAAPRSSIR
jgi:hypothetical protein